MKKVLKSIVIFVLTFAMVFSIVACADQSDPNDTPPSTATEKMLKVKKPFLTSTTFPMSVDPENVYFGWEAEATIRGAMQRSYRIIVADNVKDIDNNRGNVWDSGWILSDRQTGIPCGTDLSPETVYYYKVNLRDQNGKAAGYSPAAVFETGVDAMHGYYIGGSGAKILRKVFSMEKDLKDIQRARLSVTSGSYLEPHMNGQKIGNLYDAPGRTVSDIETLINTYNILPYLKNGDNAVGFLIGDLYGYGPSVKAEINIYYNDGTVQRIVTAETPVYEGARIFQSDAYAVGGYLMQDRAVFYLLGFGTVLAITPILGLIKPLASLGQRTLPIYILHMPLYALLVQLGCYEACASHGLPAVITWLCVIIPAVVALCASAPVCAILNGIANIWYKTLPALFSRRG